MHALPFINHLNPEQQKAVLLTQQHLRVLAGAGSGKTQVLVSRIAALMQVEQLPPSAFLAVTFTNKAANEMRTRLATHIQTAYDSLWVGTFHHLAHRLLRIHHEAAGLAKDFQILDSADQQRRLRRIIQEMKLDEGRFSPKAVQWFINQKKDEGLHANQLPLTTSIDPHQKILVKIFEIYEESCLKEHLLDFSDLLLRSRDLLVQNPDILQQYHERFRYILVDEFQDTSHMQYKWIKLLTGPHTYLTIVGDDDQSIYGWRGAQIENMHRFERDFANSQTIRLEQNYRSTTTILSAANALIANNQQRLGKNLWTDSQEGDAIQVYPAMNESEEARFIIKEIQKAHAAQTPYNDIAILYRSNAQSRVLEERLIQENIPYRVYGGQRFFDRSEIKDTLAYLRLINTPEDNSAFDRIINTPTRGIGQKTVELIHQTAQQNHMPYFHASHQLLSESLLSTRSAKALSGFLELITQIKQTIHNHALHTQIEKVLQLSGLLDHYQKDHPDHAQTRQDNLNELMYAANQFALASEEATLASFINKMTLDSSEYQSSEVQHNSVQLMTLHAAKGLEFPIVFLTGLEEGLFPSHLSLEKPSDIEEERRLCYVGITRAMRTLYLTYARVRAYRGTETYRLPSRFIEEIPSQYLSPIHNPITSSFQSKSATASTYRKIQSDSPIGDTGFRLSQKVKHPRFGIGKILDTEGEGEYARVQVKFDTVGTKWLIINFAKLIPI